MKKKMMALLLCLPLLCMTAYASPEGETFDVQSRLEASGVNELFDELPSDTAEALHRAGIDGASCDELMQFGTGDVIRSLLEMAQSEIRTPLGSLGFMMALLLLAAFFKGGEDALDSSLSPTVGTVMSISVSVTMAVPILSLINQIAECVQSACTFTEAFGAVFIGILIANGQNVLAAGCSTFLFGAVEVCTVCVGELIVPMLKIFLALSCVSAISDGIKIEAIVQFFEKNAKWLLSFLGVLLSAVLGISGVIAGSADDLASRTAKFVISGSVPVVGGAVSDAYLTIRSGMALLRNSVGAFGIIAVGYIYFPLVIRTVLWRWVTEIGLALCETLKLESVGKLLKSLSGMISLMLAVLVFSLFLLTLGSIAAVLQKTA